MLWTKETFHRLLATRAAYRILLHILTLSTFIGSFLGTPGSKLTHEPKLAVTIENKSFIFYSVRRNDTYTSIAARFGLSAMDLFRLNRDEYPDDSQLPIGARVLIPLGSHLCVPDGFSVASK